MEHTEQAPQILLPIVIKNMDGTCTVSFPEGTALSVLDFAQASELVNQYITRAVLEEYDDEPEDKRRRIGFPLPHWTESDQYL